MFNGHLQSENNLILRERPLLQMPKPNAQIKFEVLLAVVPLTKYLAQF